MLDPRRARVLLTIGLFSATATQACLPSSNKKAQTESKAPAVTIESFPAAEYGKADFDFLDVLPATIGESRIERAWRISAAGVDTSIGQYDWPGVTAEVLLTCHRPISKVEPDCDSGLPIKLYFEKIPACGTENDGPDGEGPMIDWPGCFLGINKAGVRTKRRFERLKAGAAAAAPWTLVVTAAAKQIPKAALMANRKAGLVEASRRGHPDMTNLRGQLDP
jgi:hypothetical protein